MAHPLQQRRNLNVLMVLVGHRVRGTERAVPVSRSFALAIPALLVPLQLLDFLPGNYDVRTTRTGYGVTAGRMATSLGRSSTDNGQSSTRATR